MASKKKVSGKATILIHRVASIDSLTDRELRAAVKLLLVNGEWVHPGNPVPYNSLVRKGWAQRSPNGLFSIPGPHAVSHHSFGFRDKLLHAAGLKG